MFYCRENELRKLGRRYERDTFECIIIYGRRRVGKTALINRFVEDKPVIYFSALNAASWENLHALSKAINTYKDPEAVSCPEYPSYEDALEEIGRMARDRRIIFVIDEYPYLAKAEPSISSRLQHLIDHRWINTKLYLILCGSSMSFMQNQVLGYESPLYGRRTAQFKIEPLSYRETALFYPQLSDEEQAYVYGITGGIPHYINKLEVEDSLDEALLETVFDRSGYLFEEPENLLKQELREPALYNSIIGSIAAGASKLNEIAGNAGLDSGVAAKYIRSLVELGIVKKEFPMTENTGKKTVYHIEDNFFRFWYRFVPQNLAAISSDRMRNIYQKAVKSQMHDYMGLIFEKMCREYLTNYGEKLSAELGAVGQWWGTDPVLKKQIQIDIVGEIVSGQDQKRYLVGSCKFKREKVGTDELELLRRYGQVFAKGQIAAYYIFSLSGFTEGLLEMERQGEVCLVSLEKMYHGQRDSGT